MLNNKIFMAAAGLTLLILPAFIGNGWAQNQNTAPLSLLPLPVEKPSPTISDYKKFAPRSPALRVQETQTLEAGKGQAKAKNKPVIKSFTKLKNHIKQSNRTIAENIIDMGAIIDAQQDLAAVVKAQDRSGLLHISLCEASPLKGNCSEFLGTFESTNSQNLEGGVTE